MSWKSFFLGVATLSLALFLSGPAQAQAPFIQGLVRDNCGKPLSGVTVRGWDGQRTVTALSDGKGEYVLRGLAETAPLAIRWERAGRPSVRIDSVRLPEAGALFLSLEYAETSPGGTFVVRIPTNPSTGYSWNLLSGGDESVLFASGNLLEASRPEPFPQGRSGAGVEQLWLFRALKRGTTTVTLAYSRHWETVPASRIHIASLTVR